MIRRSSPKIRLPIPDPCSPISIASAAEIDEGGSPLNNTGLCYQYYPLLRARLGIPHLNVEFDDLLTTALTALSARFDRETNRTFTRTANTTHEFDAFEI